MINKRIIPWTVAPQRLRLAALLISTAAALGACTTTQDDTTASIPNDYRLRHPIVIQEADRTVEVLVGTRRGGLTASQRADVTAFAEAWLHEGTGGIAVDLPTATPNSYAANQTLHEIESIFAAVGVPANAVKVREYRPEDPRQLATIKLNYPKIVADAGPCGVWPEDLGPTFKNRIYQENKPYYNLGCAYQRNMAAMVANPSDLIQPRPETPNSATRRSTVLTKYGKSEPTAVIYPDADKGKLSDVGK
jgi:pilus assembly protein CpaD